MNEKNMLSPLFILITTFMFHATTQAGFPDDFVPPEQRTPVAPVLQVNPIGTNTTINGLPARFQVMPNDLPDTVRTNLVRLIGYYRETQDRNLGYIETQINGRIMIHHFIVRDETLFGRIDDEFSLLGDGTMDALGQDRLVPEDTVETAIHFRGEVLRRRVSREGFEAWFRGQTA